MRKLLCFLGFHNWNYTNKENRTCKSCNRSETYINEGPVSGMADFDYWKKV